MLSEKDKKGIPKCQTGRKGIEVRAVRPNRYHRTMKISYLDTGWGLGFQYLCIQERKPQTLTKQGSRNLRQVSHPGFERDWKLAREATLAHGSYEELVSEPLGGKKTSTGNEKPRTIPCSMQNSNSHHLYGTGNRSQTTNIKMDLELLKPSEFPVETNAKALYRSIFITHRIPGEKSNLLKRNSQ